MPNDSPRPPPIGFFAHTSIVENRKPHARTTWKAGYSRKPLMSSQSQRCALSAAGMGSAAIASVDIDGYGNFAFFAPLSQVGEAIGAR